MLWFGGVVQGSICDPSSLCHAPCPFLFNHNQRKLLEIILLLRENISLLRANGKSCCPNAKSEIGESILVNALICLKMCTWIWMVVIPLWDFSSIKSIQIALLLNFVSPTLTCTVSTVIGSRPQSCFWGGFFPTEHSDPAIAPFLFQS